MRALNMLAQLLGCHRQDAVLSHICQGAYKRMRLARACMEVQTLSSDRHLRLQASALAHESQCNVTKDAHWLISLSPSVGGEAKHLFDHRS